uniref:Uncharacterized protein n=1 Tax=Timspurckia oligopyrenoides TaxID=708627 RepID=A0A7S1ESE8_9RHOD|mmetsp:Transcript_4969/g.8632  ORF Transcript_4969/g.8632 Transcript_4969/m.8632 type:complete len:391 (+) Transcript_4969:209-1381(+)
MERFENLSVRSPVRPSGLSLNIDSLASLSPRRQAKIAHKIQVDLTPTHTNDDKSSPNSAPNSGGAITKRTLSPFSVSSSSNNSPQSAPIRKILSSGTHEVWENSASGVDSPLKITRNAAENGVFSDSPRKTQTFESNKVDRESPRKFLVVKNSDLRRSTSVDDNREWTRRGRSNTGVTQKSTRSYEFLKEEDINEEMDRVLLANESGNSMSFYEYRNALSDSGFKRIVVVLLCNFLAEHSINQYYRTIEIVSIDEDQDEKHEAIIVIGTGPSKFIKSFCTNAKVQNKSLNQVCYEKDEKEGDGNVPVIVLSDVDRRLYALVTKYKASRFESPRSQTPNSSDLVSGFSMRNKLAETTNKGLQFQYIAYCAFDPKLFSVRDFEVIVTEKFGS